MISIDSIVEASKQQVSCDLEGEAAILNLKNGVYYGLNPVGARIWELIQTPRKVKDILEIVIEEYAVERERCEYDLLELLKDLVAQDLIEVRNESGA